MFAISEDVVDLAARPPSLNAVGTPVVSAEDDSATAGRPGTRGKRVTMACSALWHSSGGCPRAARCLHGDLQNGVGRCPRRAHASGRNLPSS